MAYQVVNGGMANRSFRSPLIPVCSSLAFLFVGGVMLCKLLWTGTAPASHNIGYHFKVVNGKNANINADDGTGSSNSTKLPQVLRWGSNVYKGLYTGEEWTSPRTVDRTIVADTAFARCEIHSVKADDGSSDVIHDWLWFDEKDAVNVAVVNDLGQFVVMKQRKYGIEGETLSPVGGMIEDGESPFEAARREVEEELGLGSRMTLHRKERLEAAEKEQVHPEEDNSAEPTLANGEPHRNNDRYLKVGASSPLLGASAERLQQQQTPSITNSNGMGDGSVPAEEAHDWTYLGKYRVAANRGGGFVHTYLLQNAVPLAAGGGTSGFKSTGDGEAQHILQLSMAETQKALGNAEFKEIKWAATMSFALMQIQARAFSAHPLVSEDRMHVVEEKKVEPEQSPSTDKGVEGEEGGGAKETLSGSAGDDVVEPAKANKSSDHGR